MGISTSDVYLDKAVKRWTLQIRNDGLFIKDFICPKDSSITEKSGKFRLRSIEHMTQQDGKANVGTQGDPVERSFALSDSTYYCENYAYKAFVTNEMEAHAESPIKPLRDHATMLMDEGKLQAEIRVRDMLQAIRDTAGRFTIPSVKWDAASGAKILKNIKAAKRSVRQGCGALPNYILIPDHIMDEIIEDSGLQTIVRDYKELDLIKGQYPSMICGMTVLIPGALEQTANLGTITPPATGVTITDLWSVNSSGTTLNDVWLIHSNPSMRPNSMNFANQFVYKDWSSKLKSDEIPGVEGGRWVKIAHSQDEKIVFAPAAHCIKNVLT